MLDPAFSRRRRCICLCICGSTTAAEDYHHKGTRLALPSTRPGLPRCATCFIFIQVGAPSPWIHVLSLQACNVTFILSALPPLHYHSMPPSSRIAHISLQQQENKAPTQGGSHTNCHTSAHSSCAVPLVPSPTLSDVRPEPEVCQPGSLSAGKARGSTPSCARGSGRARAMQRMTHMASIFTRQVMRAAVYRPAVVAILLPARDI